ncbi:MAG: dephospho-CoA kinase [Gammaproteobacteria bacterium]|nr:dephospho-CoA kinase [Gammaproteobacteria bacterium]
MAEAMLRIGLTGGIASGKSTVADMFSAYGIPVIDTDEIARDVVTPGSPGLAEVQRQFGAGVIASDGTLDRAALRKIIFENDEQRKVLEAILHPRIREETMRRAAVAGGPYQIIVVPLLVESTLKSFMSRIVVVDCDPQTQLERLLSRDAENLQQAKRIIASQSSREQRLAIASDVIVNDGDIAETRRQVDDLHRRFLELAESARD